MNTLMQIYDKKITVPTGAVNGVMRINSDDEYSTSESEDDGDNTHYEQDFVKEEMGKYAQFSVDGNKKFGEVSLLKSSNNCRKIYNFIILPNFFRALKVCAKLKGLKDLTTRIMLSISIKITISLNLLPKKNYRSIHLNRRYVKIRNICICFY